MRVRGAAIAVMGLWAATGVGAQEDHGGHADGTAAEVAASVDGKWDLTFRAPWGDVEMTLDLTQQEQRLRGFAVWGARRVTVDRGRIRGDDVSFVIVAGDGVTHSIDMLFEGTLREDTMHGSVGGWDGAPSTWTAERDGT
jgi:hypothetical protein